MNLLVICHDIEPLQSPQAIQIGRLLAHLQDCNILLATGQHGTDTSPARSIPSLRHHLRHPDPHQTETPLARLARLTLPLAGKVPDRLGPWRNALLARINPWLAGMPDKPDILLSFGEPMSDHLVALELKRKTGLPWLAHFSDPWADNPFRRGGPLTKAVNRRLERDVIMSADLVVFTSQETAELVGARYSSRETTKFRVLPHGFDAKLYPAREAVTGPVVIRHIGSFYGKRTPFPLLQALQLLSTRDRDIANRLKVELVGSMPQRMIRKVQGMNLPAGLVALRGSVTYADSIALMTQSHLLAVIDAPALKSVFLASKLIDYVGAGRPIFAITPEGAARSLVERLGGIAVSPQSIEAIAEALDAAIRSCDATRCHPEHPWGVSDVRQEYEAGCVAALFKHYINECITLTSSTKATA